MLQRTFRNLLLLLFASLLSNSALRAQLLDRAGISDSAGFAFLRQLQAAVRRNDPLAVWRLTGPGIVVDWPDSEEDINSSSVFVARYHAVFTPDIRNAILNQQPESLFARWNGVLIAYGKAVFNSVGARIALQVITEPGWTGYYRRPLKPLDPRFVPKGQWWPAGEIACPYICGLVDPQDSVTWWRDGLTLGPDLVALGRDTCRTPVYHTRRVDGDKFLDDWRFRPHQINLNDSLVTEFDIGCPENYESSPGQIIWIEDSTHIWVPVSPGRVLRLMPFRADTAPPKRSP